MCHRLLGSQRFIEPGASAGQTVFHCHTHLIPRIEHRR
ncbi:MAG: HIT domain-containing protein [Gammaproteobacteria bacterium]|nr:HIT domain-containing protein [Gammaproteobacteria bacterium]